MGNDKIREPVQKRSIEKKNRIIEIGFQLLCENGYQKTTTQDIAKAAGVSTGIIYNYFNDKHDIFILGLERLVNTMFLPLLDRLFQSPLDDLEESINLLLDSLIELHFSFHKAHNELEAMTYSDPDVAIFMSNLNQQVITRIVAYFINGGYPEEGLIEKVQICFDLFENFCHGITFHRQECINYDVMRKILVETIIHILS